VWRGDVACRIQFSVRTHESCLAAVALAAENARFVCTGSNLDCLVRCDAGLPTDPVAGAFFVGRSAAGTVRSTARTAPAGGGLVSKAWCGCLLIPLVLSLYSVVHCSESSRIESVGRIYAYSAIDVIKCKSTTLTSSKCWV